MTIFCSLVMLLKVYFLLCCSNSAAANIMFNKAQQNGNYCWPEGKVVCSAGFFQICASGLWSTKMSLAQGTICGIFNEGVSAPTSDFPLSIDGNSPGKDVRVSITRFGSETSVATEVSDSQLDSGIPTSQITTHLVSAPTETLSGFRLMTSTYYSGPASDFPTLLLWVPFRLLWSLNKSVCELNPGKTPQLINNAIRYVASESGVDARVIFAVVLQESTCLLSAVTSKNGAGNYGLMQSHNGVGYSSTASILQMIKDGTEGTYYQGVDGGDGLRQVISRHGVYGGLRAYNSGENGININNLSSVSIGTPSYVSDVANRLVGAMIAH